MNRDQAEILSTGVAASKPRSRIVVFDIFPSVLFALAIFVWFCARNWSALGGLRTSRVLRLLSGASFGVYVVHMFVIEGVCALFDLNANSVAWRLLGPPLVYLIFLCGVLLAQRIPYIKKIVP